MDKEEFRIKLNQINHLVDEKQYKEAMEVVDSIDWRRVKNVHTLCVVGEIYAANKRYAESKEIFLLAYHRAPIGKNILYRLIEVSLKMKDVQEAEEFYEEYLEVAPNDSTQYILRYKISKAENASIEEQIRILEDYKEKEFTERWSYELAKLYYQKGETRKCLDLCNDIIIWFSEGRYVLKAMDLKNRMGQLTGAEKEKYEQKFVPNLTTVDQAAQTEGTEPQDVMKYDIAADEDAPVIETVRIDERDVNSAESLQEKISKGIRDIFNGKKKDAEDELTQEEEEIPEDKIQDEMLRDLSAEEENKDVPELEEEPVFSEETTEEKITDEIAAAEEPAEEAVETEASDTEDPSEIQIPEAPEIGIPEEEEASSEEGDDFDFNLEDMILSAASAQGIEIPKEEVKNNQNTLQEEDEDYMSEEDLQSAEDEFMNGPSGRAGRDGDEIRGEDSFEDDELEEDDFYENEDDSEDDFQDEEEYDSFEDEEEDFYEDDIDEEDDFYGDEEESDEDDFDEEDPDEEDDFYEDEEDDFYEDEEEEFEELPVVSKRPLPERRTSERRNAQIKKPDPSRKTVFKEEPVKKAEPRRRKKTHLSEAEELERFVDAIRPQEAMDIIPRQKVLTDYEKKLFTYFAKVPGLREQLIDTLCDVQLAAADKTSKTGNIIVMGGHETGKTRLISGLIPAICKELNLEAAKVAYVFAEQINGKNIPAIVKKMAGGFLVIENANKLKKETVNQLGKAMDSRTDGMIVILEDEKIGMRKLMARFPKFTTRFTSMINIPVFTNDELVNFAMIYTRERGYTIDSRAMLALYNLISVNQKDDQPMNVGAVKEIIDNAISRSTGGIRKLSRNISKKRTDVDGYIVLYEKDFN